MDFTSASPVEPAGSIPVVEDSTAVLAAAAGAARYAPSIHNTQPWQWELDSSTLRLRVARDRQLEAADPSGRLLTVSCGASLHYARASVTAQGRQPAVVRFPDSADPEVLAEITVAGSDREGERDTALYRAMLQRRTDRRPLREPRVDAATLEELQTAAESEGAHLHVLRQPQVVRLAAAVSQARTLDLQDTSRQREHAEWVGGDPAMPSGVPDAVFAPHGGPYQVPLRFSAKAEPQQAARSPLKDAAATFLILFTDEDHERAWLRGGEALSRVWARATQFQLAVTPLSSVVELAVPRLELYRVLSHVGHPLLVLRIGHPDESEIEPPLTARLPSA